MDGPDLAQVEILETRIDHLAGLNHSETGVQFLESTVELPNGELQIYTNPTKKEMLEKMNLL